MRRFLPLILLLPLFVSSCGGGGGSPAPNPTPTPTPSPTPAPTTVRVRVQWAARSRTEALFSGPSSARSVRVQVGNSGTVVLSANRNTGTDSYTETLTSTATLPPGAQAFSVAFYASPDQSGPVVAQGNGTLTLENDGTLSGTVTLQQAVQSVAVVPGQSVVAGNDVDIAFLAKDSAGSTVAVSPGSGFLSLADSASATLASVTTGNLLHGLAAGVAKVRVTVDGVASPAEAVTVLIPVSVTVTPSSHKLTLEQQVSLSASVLGTTNTKVTWSVQEGATGGSVTAAGVYTAPKTAGTYHVIATSEADATKTGTATITVTSGSGTITIQ